MKRFIRIMLLALFGAYGMLSAQHELYNDGSLIHVENGAAVYVQGEVHNNSGNLENEGMIELEGDWTNSGSYMADLTGRVRFSGTDSAYIAGNMTGNNDFFFLEIAKSGPNAYLKKVRLDTDIEVDGSLDFTSGWIGTGIHEVFVTNAAPTAISGHSQAGSGADDRYVAGYLKRDVTVPGANYDFPVGEAPYALGYQLLKVELSALGGSQALTGFFQAGNPTAPNVAECGPTYYCSLGNHGEWFLLPDQGMPTYDLQAVPRNFTTDCGVGTYTLSLGGQLLGDPCIVYTGPVNPGAGTIIPRTGLNSLGPIAVTGSGGVLPVELLSFTGQREDHTVALEWVTEYELNNDYFELERSADGESFSTIYHTPGQGTTDEITVYDYVDAVPMPGTNYYRLKQVDFDGSFQYSNIVQVEFEVIEGLAEVAPNPFQYQFSVHIQAEFEKAKFELFNLHGQLVLTQKLTKPVSEIHAGHLAEGVYYYRIQEQGRDLGMGKLVRSN